MPVHKIRSLAVGTLITVRGGGADPAVPVYASREVVDSVTGACFTEALVKARHQPLLVWRHVAAEDTLCLALSLDEAKRLTDQLAAEAAQSRPKKSKRQTILMENSDAKR